MTLCVYIDVCDVIYFNQYCGSVLFCLVEFFYLSSFYNPIRELFQFVLSLIVNIQFINDILPIAIAYFTRLCQYAFSFIE